MVENEDDATMLSALGGCAVPTASPIPNPKKNQGVGVVVCRARSSVESLASQRIDVTAVTELERTAGLRLATRTSSAVSDLCRSASGRTFIRLRALVENRNLDALRGTPWVTLGIVARKLDPRSGSNGSSYGLVRLWSGDSLCSASGSSAWLSLSGVSFEKTWGLLTVGVLVIVAEAVLQRSNRPVASDSREMEGLLLKASSASTVSVLGRSEGIAPCGFATKAGNACDILVNLSKGASCTFHLSAAARGAATKTAETRHKLVAPPPSVARSSATVPREQFVCTKRGIDGAVDSAGVRAGHKFSQAPLGSFMDVSAPLSRVAKAPMQPAPLQSLNVEPDPVPTPGSRMLFEARQRAIAAARATHDADPSRKRGSTTGDGVSLSLLENRSRPPQPTPERVNTLPPPMAKPVFVPLRVENEERPALGPLQRRARDAVTAAPLFAVTPSKESSLGPDGKSKGLAALVGLSHRQLHKAATENDSCHTAYRAADEARRKEKALEAIEREAAVHDALSEVREVEVTAFRCHTCGRWTPQRPGPCVDAGHAVLSAKTTRRFYDCNKCAYHLELLGDESTPWLLDCPRCGVAQWRRGTAARQQIIPVLDQHGDRVPVSDDFVRAMQDGSKEAELVIEG